jgi:hypothetical protein
MDTYSTVLYIAYSIYFLYIVLAFVILYFLLTCVKKSCRFAYITNKVAEDQYQKMIENKKHQKKIT